MKYWKQQRSKSGKKIVAFFLGFLLLLSPVYAASESYNQNVDLGISGVRNDDNQEDIPKNSLNLLESYKAEIPPHIELGHSQGRITIDAPDRKIALGLSDFDLLHGVKAHYPDGSDALESLDVESQGDFNPSIPGDYKVGIVAEEEGNKPTRAARQITVTDFTVEIDDITIPHNPNPETTGKNGEGEIVQPSLTQEIRVIDPDKIDYSSYLEVLDDDGFDVRVPGEYQIEYAVVFQGDTLVQTNRTVTVRSFFQPRSARSARAAVPNIVTIGSVSSGDFYVEVARNGNYNVMSPTTSYQFYGRWANGLVWFVNKGDVRTKYSTSYLNNNTGTSGGNTTDTGTLGMADSLILTNGDRTAIHTWDKRDGEGHGYVFKQYLTMSPDSKKLSFKWEIENHTDSPITYRFYQGGDTYFSGEDYGTAYYNARNKMVYIRKASNPDKAGIMSYRADLMTPAQYFFGGHYSQGQKYFVGKNVDSIEHLPGDFSIPNPKVNINSNGNVSSGKLDQSFYMEWDGRTVAPGTTDSIGGEQQWTDAGTVQVLSPEGKKAPSGVTLPYAFTLENMTDSSQTVTLSVASENGWNAEIYGGTSVTVSALGSKDITLFLSVPPNQPDGKQDLLTLSVKDSSNNTLTGKTTTTIDNSLPAIQNIRITDQTDENIWAAVDFTNIPTGEARSTFVQILDDKGVELTPKREMTIPDYQSGQEGRFKFSLEGLEMEKAYIVRAYVEGIDYYSEQIFTISTLASDLTLERAGVVNPTKAVFNAKSPKEMLTGKIKPDAVVNKSITWSANPSDQVTNLPVKGSSGSVQEIVFGKDGVVTVTAKAAAPRFPSRSIEYTVDRQAPEITEITVAGGEAISKPQKITITADDVKKDGFMSGKKAVYFKMVTAGTGEPSFDPANPGDWTKYKGDGTDTVPTNQEGAFSLYAVVVDNVENYSIKKYEQNLIVDTTPPVIEAKDIHIFKDAEALVLPNQNVSAKDGGTNLPLDSTNTTAKINGSVATSFQPTSLGKTEVVYTITDKAGNSATAKQFIYVQEKINLQVDSPITIHVRDTAEDLDFLTDQRLNLVSQVQITENDGTIQTKQIVPTHDGNTKVEFGKVGTYSVTYTANYQYPAPVEGTKDHRVTTTLEVIITDENVPGGPAINLKADTLKTFRDYPEGQIQETIIPENVRSPEGTLTYRILDKNNRVVELAEIHNPATPIANYRIEYKLKDAIGRTSYEDVTLKVYGKLQYSGLTNIHVVEKMGGVILPKDYQAKEGYSPVTLSYEAFDDATNQIVLMDDGKLTIPGALSIDTVGRTEITYEATYPFDSAPIEKGNRFVFVHGEPVITANSSIGIHVADTEADFNPLTDQRVGLKASVEVVREDGRIETKTIPNSTITLKDNLNPIQYGTKGSYKVTYEVPYVHHYDSIRLETIGQKDSTVIVDDSTPGGPDISLKAPYAEGYWHFQGSGTSLTDEEIKESVTLAPGTEGALVEYAGYQIETQGENARVVTLEQALSASPATYTLRHKATDNQGRTSYYYVDLKVVGPIETTKGTPLHVATHNEPLEKELYNETSQGAPTGFFVDHTGKRVKALLTIPAGDIPINEVRFEALSYSFQYPTSYPAPSTVEHLYKETRDLSVHGYPEINANSIVRNKLDPPVNLKTYAPIGLGAKAEYIENGVKKTKTFTLSELEPTGTVNWGTNGTYSVTYETSYTPGGTLLLASKKNITVTINDEGDPNAPVIKLAEDGKDPFRYFQGFDYPSNLDESLKNNVTVSSPDGAELDHGNLRYLIFQNGRELSLESAKEQVGSYTVQYQITDNQGRVGYFTSHLEVIGDIVLGEVTPIDVQVGETGALLPQEDYTGTQGISATFTAPDGTVKNATVKASDVVIDQVGQKKILYTASYPSELEAPASLNRTKERLVRVHGIPVIEKMTRLDLRVSTPEQPLTDVELLQGITAKVELAGKEEGDGNHTITGLPVSVASSHDLKELGAFQLKVHTQLDIRDKGYENDLLLETEKEDRLVVLHGHVELKGNDITLSTDFVQGDFEALARPQMNTSASVSYFDTESHQIVTDILPLTHPSSGTVRFGVKGSYPQDYTVNDQNASHRPAGLLPMTTDCTLMVVISDKVVGNAPVIQLKNSKINWLADAPVNREELMLGVTATDKEDGVLTEKITISLHPKRGPEIPLDQSFQTLSPGPYTLRYIVKDSHGNKVVQDGELRVHSKLQVERDLEVTHARESETPFRPDIGSFAASYTSGVDGTKKVVTPTGNGSSFSLNQPSYDISTRGNYQYLIHISHPVLGKEFVTPVGGVKTPTVLDKTVALKVHENILLKGYEAYNGNKVEADRDQSSYFMVGDDLSDSILKNGVTATYINSDGNEVSLTKTLRLSTPDRQNKKPGTFKATYLVSDNLIPANGDTKAEILIVVDSVPAIEVETNPAYIPAGSTEEDAITTAGIHGTIYYGKNPTVPVSLDTTKVFTYQKGVDFGQPGNRATIKVSVAHPVTGRGTSTNVDVRTYIPPVVNVTGPGYLEMFKEEYTESQITKEIIKPTSTYTDADGVEKSLKVEVDYSETHLDVGGKYLVYAYTTDPYTGVRVRSEASEIYVLNRAYIDHVDTYYGTYEEAKAGGGEYIRSIITAQGVGERVVDGAIVRESFALSGAKGTGRQIVVENFPLTFNLQRYHLKYVNQRQRIGLSGHYSYRDQDVSAQTSVFIRRYSEGGTSEPDKPLTPLPGSYDSFTKPGTDGLSIGATSFWKETEKLLKTTGDKKEAWKILHTNPLKPEKLAGTNRRVVAVPGEHLEMPRYVLQELKNQTDQTLQINLKNGYTWYLDSDSPWTDTTTKLYPMGVKDSNNREIRKLLGKGTAGQQLTFGFEGGWNTGATLAAKVKEKDLQGKPLYLYFYNSYTGELEFLSQMKDLGNNWYSSPVSGTYGEYVITDKLFQNTRIHEDHENPDTGGWLRTPTYTHQLIEDGTLKTPSESLGEKNSSFLSPGWLILPLSGLLVFGVIVKKKRKKS